jgi:hypothetical protein
MQWNATPSTSLLPFTRLVLVVSAVVQLVFGLVGLLFTNHLWHTVFWTAPLPAWPVEATRFASLTSLTTAVAALCALKLGSWDGARVSRVLLHLHRLFTARRAGDGHPAEGELIMWLYVLLLILYLPAVAFAWFRQSQQSPHALAV